MGACMRENGGHPLPPLWLRPAGASLAPRPLGDGRELARSAFNFLTIRHYRGVCG
jgi:hypothetical protein